MSEKKRKGLPTSSDGPKKSKKVKVVAAGPAPTLSAPDDGPSKTKAGKKSQRGRAADYMSENEDKSDKKSVEKKSADKQSAPVPTAAPSAGTASSEAKKEKAEAKGKKSKHNSKQEEILTADGTNGVVEHAETAEVEALPGSMQAEAQQTVEAELREEYGSGEEGDATESGDLGAALLAGFDSDTSDHAEDTGLDVNHLGGIPHYKKTKKKLSKIVKSRKDKPGAVYVGRIPHGFYEREMREYFSQFGDITRLRLSRNRRTGASKHFAFVEFASEEVAKIVAETMDNYLMFGHILKCKFAPAENLHEDVWKGANKKFRKIPHQKLERQKLEESKTVDQWKKKNQKETKRRETKAKALKEKLGYDAPAVQLAEPAAALKENKIEAEKTKAIEAEKAPIEAAKPDEASTMTPAAIEAPKKATAAEDAVTDLPVKEQTSEADATVVASQKAAKKEKKEKKEKKHGKKTKAG